MSKPSVSDRKSIFRADRSAASAIRPWIERPRRSSFQTTMQSPACAKRRASKPRLIGFRAARLIGEQLFAPGFVQGVGLQRQILIGRRNTRITNQHLSRFRIEIGDFGNLKSGTDFGKAKPTGVRQRDQGGGVPARGSIWGKPPSRFRLPGMLAVRSDLPETRRSLSVGKVGGARGLNFWTIVDATIVLCWFVHRTFYHSAYDKCLNWRLAVQRSSSSAIFIAPLRTCPSVYRWYS